MDNIKQVVKDIKFLIATGCCDETIQSRIENFINEREEALRIHGVIKSVCDVCGSDDVIEAPHMGKNCNRCHPL